MSDGSLSQDEIDALLQGTDSIEMDADTGGGESELSGAESEAFQGMLKGLVESQSSNLSMLTGKTIRIDSPTLEVVARDQLASDLPGEVVEVKIDFLDGLNAAHSYLLPAETATSIAGLMLGQEGIELDEMALSTVGEAISNITGPVAAELENRIGQTVQTDNPASRTAEAGQLSLPEGDTFVKIEYPFTLEGDMPSRLIEVFPFDMVKELAGRLTGAGAGGGGAAQETGAAGGGRAGGMAFGGGAQQPAGGAQQTFGQPLQGPQPGSQAPPPNVQPVQFANLQPSSGAAEQGNIGLLMDVFMEMTVELGRTKKLIKEILTIGEGTIIELDKLAGEPVDILVNHKLIAKGEVVVIDENFGVRVTEIVSPMERMSDLT